MSKLTVAEAAAMGDFIALLRDRGRSGLVLMNGQHEPVPYDVRVEYADDGQLRRVKITAGWTQKEWKERSAPVQADSGQPEQTGPEPKAQGS